MNHALYNEHRRTAAKLDNCTLHNLLRKEDDMANKKDSTMLVKDFVKKWLLTVKKKEVKVGTYARLETSAKTMGGFPIGEMKLKDVKSVDFREYIQQLIDYGYSQSTIKKTHADYQCANGICVQRRHYPNEPVFRKITIKICCEKADTGNRSLHR